MSIRLLTIFLCVCFKLSALCASTEVKTTQSLYLGESKKIDFKISEKFLGKNISWSVDNSELIKLDAGDLIFIEPRLDDKANKLSLILTVPYIAPSFQDLIVIVTGTDESGNVIKIELNLTVRAELVIRFRSKKDPKKEKSSKLLSAQADSVFDWDLPKDPQTGDYTSITVNNHAKGLWVRFRYEGGKDDSLLYKGGYLIHIYRGEGEYIVHQPFSDDSNLRRSDCPLEPISIEEWKNPELGLTAEGSNWVNCEFRGFVPAGTAYGFGFREHYLENEDNQKFVEIKNVGELNRELIDYYKFLEENGLSISALCTSW